MRCDLHVHSTASGMCDTPGLSRICKESYNDPAEVYDRCKRLGMSMVTLTDHDSIDAAEVLRKYSDFFLSEEATVKLPTGTLLHLGRLWNRGKGPRRNSAPPRRFCRAADVSHRAQTFLQRQPSILQPYRPPRCGRLRLVRLLRTGLRSAQRTDVEGRKSTGAADGQPNWGKRELPAAIPTRSLASRRPSRKSPERARLKNISPACAPGAASSTARTAAS